MLKLEPAEKKIWLATARVCPWATYFHSPAWADCMAEIFPEFRAEALGSTLADGTFVLLPAVVKKKKRLLGQAVEYKSMEPGVYGGFIAGRALTAAEVQELAAAVLKLKNSAGRIVETPWQPLSLPATFISKKLETHIVELPPDFEALQSRFSRGQKSNLSQARRKGVTVRRAQSEQDIHEYFAIYLESVKRWGETAGAVYAKELFLRLHAAGDPQVQFWLAEVEGRIAAGVLTLAWGTTIVYWHGAALPAYFKHYPNNLLHAELMAWGCANGYGLYDMGSSAGLEGVARFKESFGAQAQTYRSYRWK